ncbi:hypothetical protein ACNA06_04910 [Lysinibacillus sp. RSDA_15]|nr:hypothetical protein [Lysinibacillus sphaericus]MDM5351659.1 hypothetical protein [Lysinibacillus sphaericus]
MSQWKARTKHQYPYLIHREKNADLESALDVMGMIPTGGGGA